MGWTVFILQGFVRTSNFGLVTIPRFLYYFLKHTSELGAFVPMKNFISVFSLFIGTCCLSQDINDQIILAPTPPNVSMNMNMSQEFPSVVDTSVKPIKLPELVQIQNDLRTELPKKKKGHLLYYDKDRHKKGQGDVKSLAAIVGLNPDDYGNPYNKAGAYEIREDAFERNSKGEQVPKYDSYLPNRDNEHYNHKKTNPLLLILIGVLATFTIIMGYDFYSNR